MALRLAEADQRQMDYARDLTVQGIGAFKISKKGTTPLAKDYRGTGAKFELAFTGIPGLSGPIEDIIRIGSGLASRQLLSWEIQQDTVPFFDKYRVIAFFAGDYDIPPNGLEGEGVPEGVGEISQLEIHRPGVGLLFAVPGLLVIAAAVGTLAIFGVIAWKLSRISWGETVQPFQPAILIIAGGIAAAVVVMVSRRRQTGGGRA